MKLFLTTCLLLLLSAFGTTAQLNNYAVGDDAPDFTVTDVHGQVHHLSDYAGKWVIIDFYAYWCGPCMSIATEVNEFYQKYGCNGYDIILLGIEYEGTNQQVEAIEQSFGFANPAPAISGLEGGGAAVHAQYGVAGFPTLVLIGPDGKFRDTQLNLFQSMIVACIEGAVINAGGTDALIPHSCSALNTDEILTDKISVYPNPVTDDAMLNVTFTASGSAEIVIRSITGTVISTTGIETDGLETTLPLELSGLAAGTYFVQITQGETTSAPIPVVKN